MKIVVREIAKHLRKVNVRDKPSSKVQEILYTSRPLRKSQRGRSAKYFIRICCNSSATCSRGPKSRARKKAILIEILNLGCWIILTRVRNAWFRRKLARSIPTPTFPAINESCNSGLFDSAAIVRGWPGRQLLVKSWSSADISCANSAPGAAVLVAGLILQGVAFGFSHGYYGKAVIAIMVHGCLLGLLAWWRKSLLPGMLAHGLQDSLGVIIPFIWGG